MKKAKEHANELVVAYSNAVMNENFGIFKNKLSLVWAELVINEVKELEKARNIKLDTALVPIFKDQRQKYWSICKIVNTVKADLLSISDFDEVVKAIYPNIYEWYVKAVLA
jgi:hypothetical protein